METTTRILLVATAILAGAVEASGQDAEVAAALAAYDPALRPVDEHVVRADFDGDADLDAAVVATDGSRATFLVLQTHEGGWRVQPLYARLPDGPVRLRKVPPGTHRVLGDRRSIELEHPAVELVFPGRSSALYVWRGGRWQVFGTEGY